MLEAVIEIRSRETLSWTSKPMYECFMASDLEPFQRMSHLGLPGEGRSPGEGHGNPLQYSRLENPMDRGARRASARGVTKSRTQLTQLISTLTHPLSSLCNMCPAVR